MAKNNVYSNAKVLKSDDNGVENYTLGTFLNNGDSNQNTKMQNVSKLDERELNGNVDPVLIEMRALSGMVSSLQEKMTLLENNGMTGREIDKQVVEAIKDLKHYATFFEQASFQMETKLLKTSMAIAKKIISIEVGENSSSIAKETIANILGKIKNASKIKIHLNPKDYIILKSELNVEPYIELLEDSNVTIGGVVIASDLGNFDGNIESKVASILESLDMVI